jgi:hypothetical protein
MRVDQTRHQRASRRVDDSRAVGSVDVLRDPRDDVSDNQNIRVLQQRLIGFVEDVRVAQQNDGIRFLRMGVR